MSFLKSGLALAFLATVLMACETSDSAKKGAKGITVEELERSTKDIPEKEVPKDTTIEKDITTEEYLTKNIDKIRILAGDNILSIPYYIMKDGGQDEIRNIQPEYHENKEGFKEQVIQLLFQERINSGGKVSEKMTPDTPIAHSGSTVKGFDSIHCYGKDSCLAEVFYYYIPSNKYEGPEAIVKVDNTLIRDRAITFSFFDTEFEYTFSQIKVNKKIINGLVINNNIMIIVGTIHKTKDGTTSSRPAFFVKELIKKNQK